MELVLRIDLLWLVLFGTVLSVPLLLAVVVLNRKRGVDHLADRIEDIERRVEDLESESG
ncbi:hypothetical protein [Halorientalis pallida]|uniref:hypothetical protein n=1 Tax=Halorientalis pallida TaxID=2479928 RepID=UPI00187D357E|nr:hypothetical protein [Halorientalis pallida]